MITRTGTVRVMTRSCVKTGRNLQAAMTAAPTFRGNAASRVINDGAAIQANGVSRSRLTWSWSALATLGVTSVNSVSSSAVRVAGTSMASTAAIGLLAPLILPQGADAARAAGKGTGDDDDDKRDGKSRGLLGIRIFGGNEGGDKKDAKVGKGIESLNKEQEDTVNKMVSDLTDALKGFGDNINKAVDGAIQTKSDDEPGLISDAKKKLNEMVEKGMPAQMSFGFVMGVCCGFAAKKTAKAALVGIGLAFGSLQLLSYLGYVELDYKKIEGEVMGALDLDQDGKVNTGDVQELFDRTMKVMAYNLPAGSGFAAGAVVGARMG